MKLNNTTADKDITVKIRMTESDFAIFRNIVYRTTSRTEKVVANKILTVLEKHGV